MEFGPRTKSAAHRIGAVPCPGCNPAGRQADAIGEIPCAWCYDEKEKRHVRFVAVDVAIKYAHEHNLDIQDIPTPAQSRQALGVAPTIYPPPPEGEKK